MEREGNPRGQRRAPRGLPCVCRCGLRFANRTSAQAHYPKLCNAKPGTLLSHGFIQSEQGWRHSRQQARRIATAQSTNSLTRLMKKAREWAPD